MRTGSLFTVTSSGAVIVWLQNAEAGPDACLQTQYTHTRTDTNAHIQEKGTDAVFQIATLTESLKPT